MELRFDAQQDFQLAAIAAVIELFEGQPYIGAGITVPKGASFSVVANRLDLGDDALLANLRRVQTADGLAPDDALQCIEADIETVSGGKRSHFANVSVEMETGTGKTYVYVRTALELHRRYGLRKFIVVVPSVAIREGVLTTLAATRKHLTALYGNLAYRYDVYDSAKLGQVRNFALSNALEIMVMTIDAFARAENVIRQTRDQLSGEKPLHLIQAVRPVLILDEPQNMESEKRVEALAALDPLIALRYSATHRNPYNVVYRLTPFEAYRQGLVKRIEVASVMEEDNRNLPFLRLEEVVIRNKWPVARLSPHKLMKGGGVKEVSLLVRHGETLEGKTARTEYRGFEIVEVNHGGQFVRFANNIELHVGEARGTESEAIFEAQIRATVEEHFRKQARLREQGIKVLSLFFVDKVDSYAPDDGSVRRMFYKVFDQLKADWPDWAGIDAKNVQAAYFAAKRKRDGKVEFLDSSGRRKEDEEQFNLIMREKEKLLSFDEPRSFIFSHSALREGWDNPNVFQICALREVGEMERRQQVGRGMRLPVTQAGERIRDERLNVLTVVAGESYERFVAALQGEIEKEYGKDGTPPPPPNRRKRISAKLRKAYLLKPEFKELWERIKHKTRYNVQIDSAKLVADVLPELDRQDIRKPRVTVQKVELRAAPEDAFEAIVSSGARTAIDLAGRYPLPNIVEIMENLMERTTPPMRLSRRTLLEIFTRSARRGDALDNPHEFAQIAVGIIKQKLADQLVDGVKYEKTGEWYDMTQFAAVWEPLWADNVIPSNTEGEVGGTHLYDGVPFDSETIEKPFIQALEQRKDVKLYIKLPAWFEVDTPVGRYKPDWAIAIEDPDTKESLLYLVRETKGTLDLDGLRPDERRKVKSGHRHFAGALKVDYRIVTDANQLPKGGRIP